MRPLHATIRVRDLQAQGYERAQTSSSPGTGLSSSVSGTSAIDGRWNVGWGESKGATMASMWEMVGSNLDCGVHLLSS